MADWFRWWHGSVTDPKFGVISEKAGCQLCEVITVWVFLLENASQCHVRGDVSRFVEPNGPCHENVTNVTLRHDGVTEIAWASRMRHETVTAIVTAMCDAGLITDGRIEAWERRQPVREDAVTTGAKTAAQRAKEYRERKKLVEEKRHACVTQRHADETPQSRAEKNRVNNLSVEAASTAQPVPRDEPPAAAIDPITARAIELSALLTRRGAALQASNPTVRGWAERGITDAQALTALEIAEQRRSDQANPQAINAGFLNVILGDVINPKPKPKPREPAWWASESGIIAKGRELGIEARIGESMPEFKGRINAQIERNSGVSA